MPVYIKPTNKCNLNCSHCYVPESKRTSKERMSLRDIDTIYGKMLSHFKDEIIIIFHGGEPTLMGVNFYEHIRKNYKTPKITHLLQTNLILCTPEWDGLIEKLFNSRVGTSFDFTRTMNGSFERFQEAWLKNYSRIKSRFQVSVKFVVTKLFLEKSPLYWYKFIKGLDPGSFGFERYLATPDNSAQLDVPYKDYLQFLMDFCRVMVDNGEIPDFYPVGKDAGKRFGSGGYFSGGCMNSNIVIDTDGNITACPAFTANDLSFGNIFEEDLEHVLAGRERMRCIFNSRITDCGDCKHSLGVCGGGCYAMKYFEKIPYKASLKGLTEGKCIEFFAYLENLAALFAEKEKREAV